MVYSIKAHTASRHRVIPEMELATVKADLRKPDTRAMWAEIGACLDAARRDVGWNLEQLADGLQRDARQVRRWMAGEEQTQIAVVWRVVELQQPFVIALAKRARCRIETTVHIERTA